MNAKRQRLGLFNSPEQAVLCVLAILGFMCVDIFFFQNEKTETPPAVNAPPTTQPTPKKATPTHPTTPPNVPPATQPKAPPSHEPTKKSVPTIHNEATALA